MRDNTFLPFLRRRANTLRPPTVAHTGSESMSLLVFSLARLICSFHTQDTSASFYLYISEHCLIIIHKIGV